MVLNVVGSNPTGHPERAVSKEVALFFVDIIDKTVQWDRTHGFATDEVAEPRRRIPLGTLKEQFRKRLLFFLSI